MSDRAKTRAWLEKLYGVDKWDGRVNIGVVEYLELLDAADELDRLQEEKRAEQVKRIKAEHLRIRVQGKSYCAVDGMGWPCLSIRNLEQPSEEIVPSQPCPLPVGDRPYWMSEDQWDPCSCIHLRNHEGPCECSHTNKKEN